MPELMVDRGWIGEHADALRALGCDVAQGYHYARPMGEVEITELLERSVLRVDPLAPLA